MAGFCSKMPVVDNLTPDGKNNGTQQKNGTITPLKQLRDGGKMLVLK